MRDSLLVLFVAGSTYYGITARDFVLSIFLVLYAYTLIWVPERMSFPFVSPRLAT